ncbi:MAG: flavin reductase [Gammaproteobacteria bacterium]|nr:MAG: flavin reductase [Gammaproteobacteria bacterium]
MKTITEQQFRQAMGQFATGVAVITCLSAENNPVAMTVNSFTSVSVDPPLVLWCVNRAILPFPAFSNCSHFAIHILHAGQQDLSNHFAIDSEDKFANVPWQPGIGGIPLLEDYLALYECETQNRVDAGDHVVLVGRLLDYKLREREPLLFHAGRYRELMPA